MASGNGDPNLTASLALDGFHYGAEGWSNFGQVGGAGAVDQTEC